MPDGRGALPASRLGIALIRSDTNQLCSTGYVTGRARCAEACALMRPRSPGVSPAPASDPTPSSCSLIPRYVRRPTRSRAGSHRVRERGVDRLEVEVADGRVV